MSKGIAKKVLLLGWDAADWKVLNPLMDQGLMPNFKRLVNNGTIANLATLDPPYSPMLWTSISTGKRPYKHGVHGFTEPHPNGKDIRPVMSVSRKCKAIWNILSERGLKTHVVGWWPSHPAEHINGTMVSNFYQNHKGKLDQEWPMPKGTVAPDSMAGTMAGLRVHPQELTGGHIVPFVPKAAQIDQKKDKRLFAIAKITAHAASLHAAFTNIIRTQEWDFAALYLDAIDHDCHGFMKYHPPKRPHITQEDYDYYNYVVTAGYRYHDMMLGRIMELIDDDTLLMLISDHGFQPGDLRPRDLPNEPAAPAYEHSDYGVIAAMGPGIKKDRITFGASVIDIAPTILGALGLPLGEDMDGRVINGLFEDEIEISHIPSWEDTSENEFNGKTSLGTEEEGADEAIAQLIELGYMEKPKEDGKAAQYKRVKEECDFNLARAYIDGGEYKPAITLLEGLHKDNPEVARYCFRLASCYQAVGRLSDARQQIVVLRELEAYEEITLDVMEGALLLGENKPKEAVQLFKKAESSINTQHAQLHLQIARCYMQLGRWKEAQMAVEKEIESDVENADAHYTLGVVLLQQKYHEAASESCLRALGLDFNNPAYHFTLGQALFNQGLYEAAAQALENALQIFPQNNKGRSLLMNIYRNHLKDIAKYDAHKSLLADNTFGTVYVVSGLPRSGTSMMMQMLAAGGIEIFTDKERSADENNPRGYYEHEAVKSLGKNKNWVLEAKDKAVKVVVPLVKQLPKRLRYKVILMERNIDEIMQSQRRMLERNGKKTKQDTYNLGIKTKYETYLKETKHWAETSKNVEILYLSYKDVLNQPMEIAWRIHSFLGHELNIEKMMASVDSSLYRERV